MALRWKVTSTRAANDTDGGLNPWIPAGMEDIVPLFQAVPDSCCAVTFVVSPKAGLTASTPSRFILHHRNCNYLQCRASRCLAKPVLLSCACAPVIQTKNNVAIPSSVLI